MNVAPDVVDAVPGEAASKTEETGPSAAEISPGRDVRVPASAPELPAFSSLDGLDDLLTDGLNISPPSLNESLEEDGGPDWGVLPEPLELSKLRPVSKGSEDEEDVFYETPTHPAAAVCAIASNPRIPEHLSAFLAVGVHGGLILTPQAVLACNPADVKLEEAYEVFVQHGLGVPPQPPRASDRIAVTSTGSEPEVVAATPSPASDKQPAIDSAEPFECTSEPRSAANDASTRPSSELKAFSWMQSRSRTTVLELGRLVREDRAQRDATAKVGAEKARATADAASSAARDDASGLLFQRNDRGGASKQDPVRWIAQEEAGIALALKAVRLTNQRRAKRSGGGIASAAGGGSSSEESSIWSFLMPRSSKMRPEAAAEMARAQVAAAAAVEVMREHNKTVNEKEESRGSASSRSSSSTSAGRRPRSAPPAPLSARGGSDVCETTLEGAPAESKDPRSDDEGNEPLPSLVTGQQFPDRDEPLLTLDDSSFLARRRRTESRSSHDTLAALSQKTPGFPRALSLGSSTGNVPKPPPPARKKRVSFTDTNTIHPI
jgi:hypothetical protein